MRVVLLYEVEKRRNEQKREDAKKENEEYKGKF